MFDIWKNKYKKYKIFKRYSKIKISPDYFSHISLPVVKRVYPTLVSSQLVQIEPCAQKTLDDTKNIADNMDKLIKMLEE